MSSAVATTMLSAIPNQLIAFTSLSRPYWITSLLLGGWLALLPHFTSQAQIKGDDVLQAQRVYDFVPPPPSSIEPLQINPDGYTVPPVNTNPQRSIDFQAQPSYQNRSFARYRVLINSGSGQLLQQVRNQVDRGAYRTSFQGRSVIQAGAFSTQAGARRRLGQLRDRGIRAYVDNEQDGSNFSDRDGYYSRRNFSDRDGYYSRRAQNYYVVIPAVDGENLSDLQRKITRDVRQNRDIRVIRREQPLGPHVAVGPFYQRSVAEQLNHDLRNQGYSGARVYYGK